MKRPIKINNSADDPKVAESLAMHQNRIKSSTHFKKPNKLK